MMTRYFVFGNVWLVWALLLTLGCHVERTGPDMVSFFGVGAWLDAGTYNLLVALCVIMCVACLALAWKTRQPAD